MRRAGWDGARREIGPPLQVVVGVCLFLVVGGVLVACDLARFDVLVGFHVVGCGPVGAALPCRHRAPGHVHGTHLALRPRGRGGRCGPRAHLARGRHRLALHQHLRRRRRLHLPGQAPAEHGRAHRPVQRPAHDELRRVDVVPVDVPPRAGELVAAGLRVHVRGRCCSWPSRWPRPGVGGSRSGRWWWGSGCSSATASGPCRTSARPSPPPPCRWRRTNSWPRSGPRPKPTSRGCTSSSGSCWAGSSHCASTI